jgi:hypothetical protein
MMKYDPIGTILKTPLLRRYAGAYVSWRTRRRLQEITRPVVGIGSWGEGLREREWVKDVG